MTDTRHLRDEERELIVVMLTEVGRSTDLGALRSAQVVDMKDGGMGSVRFAPSKKTKYAVTLAEAEYTDADNILVNISLNSDQEGELMEIDFWKVDFSPLCCYPATSDLRNIRRGDSN